MIRTPIAIAVLAVAASATFSAHAVVNYEDTVTNNVIIGTGIANGDFTTDTQNNIELGLRARERYDLASDQPTNETRNEADGTYKQNAGAPASNAGRARWNFDWSININVSGDPLFSGSLAGLTYIMGLDSNAGAGTTFTMFDPINVALADHGFGNNSTDAEKKTVANPDGGIVATDSTQYALLLGPASADEVKTLVQNSWNYGFFTLPGFSPTADGVYTIYLEAYSRATTAPGALLARTSIDVIVGDGATTPPTNVPEPGSLALLGLALAGLAVSRRRSS